MAPQQVWAALEVALRVPCLYIIDAIFNSYYDSSQSRFCIALQIVLRLLGEGAGPLRPRRLCGPGRPPGRGGRAWGPRVVCARACPRGVCVGTRVVPPGGGYGAAAVQARASFRGSYLTYFNSDSHWQSDWQN